MRLASPPTLTFDAALRDLGSRDVRVRVTAAHALGDAAPELHGRAADALIGALADPSAEVRTTAALGLGDLGLERAVEPLVLCLDDGAPAVRQSAAVALGRLGLPGGFAPLAEALASGPADLRFQAATSLVEIDAARAYDLLCAALGDPDGEVVGAAALGLGAIGDQRAADALARHLDHGRRETRFDAAYALAQLADDRATATLIEFVSDVQLGWDAVEALELGGQPIIEAPLAEAMTNHRLPREIQMRAAAALLAVAPGSNHLAVARRVLLGGLSALRYRHRVLAVDLLGRVGGPWAAAPLTGLGRRLTGRKLATEIADALRRIAGRP